MTANLEAHFIGARAIVSLMRRAGGGVFSRDRFRFRQRCRAAGHGFSHYVASKMGVIGFVCALANERAVDSIIVDAIRLGITDSEGMSHMPDEMKATLYMTQAIGVSALLRERALVVNSVDA